MASRMRSAVESYAKAHNISNEQATQELASRSTRASAGMYGDAHAEWGVKPKILGVGGGLGVRGGGRAGIDWEDNDAHTASSNTQSSHNARHDIDARATQDFKEASDYFTSRKVSESGSHTDNNADSRVDQLSAALNSAKQSYDQYTTNMTRSHEYAEMASRTESMSGQMSEDLSQQFAQYVMKHAPQDADYRYDWMFKPGAMAQIAQYADGIGPDYHMLVAEGSKPGAVKLTAMVKEAHASHLQVHPYTVRADQLPEYATNVNQLYDVLYNQAGVDGLFTDFPDKAVQFLDAKR